MSDSPSVVTIGIDVAKAHLDLDARGVEFTARRLDNDPEGHAVLVHLLAELDPRLVLMEASGGYERAAACAIQGAGLAVAVVNAGRARDFAKAMGYLAKTDKIDAAMLAEYAGVLLASGDIERYLVAPSDPEKEALSAMVVRRRQLVTMLTSERQRLTLAARPVRPSITAMIKAIRAQIDDIDAEMGRHVREHHAGLEKLLRSAAGVGPVASASLIAALPELGRLNRREIAALVGVAPFANDSGTQCGRRSIRGGRFEVRRMLYMPTLTAIKHNSVIGEFYARLMAKGKPAKVALVACMRKFLTMLNAMVRTGTEWKNPAHQG